MSRILKFRAWIAKDGVMLSDGDLLADFFAWLDRWKESKGPYVVMQFTGLQDKKGVDIYEQMEIDGQYRVIYDRCSYVLQDISTGDIFGLLDSSLVKAHEREITREYAPLEKD